MIVGHMFRGGAEDAEALLDPFNAIESMYEESDEIPYPQVAVVQLSGEESASCQNGHVQISSTTNLQVYNVTAERQIYEGFLYRIKSNPALARSGVIIHEGYSDDAVRAARSADTAYPFRSDHHLNLFNAILPPDSGLEDAAWEWAREVSDQWNAGQPDRLPTAYVNYANGFETVAERYGHEEWRLEKLRALKAIYDPGNRFRVYNPIVV